MSIASFFQICHGSAIIGLSVWTHQAEQATLVTGRLQQELGVPVVWGGIHPTSYPEDAIQVADGICMGEGEDSFLNVVQAINDGSDYRTTRGFWFRDRMGRVLRNPGAKLIEESRRAPVHGLRLRASFCQRPGNPQAYGHRR